MLGADSTSCLQVRKLQEEGARLRSQVTLQQDYSRWAEGEMRAAHERLQLGLAGHVEQWRARQWARRLEQLKVANDALGGSLQVGLAGLGWCAAAAALV